MKHSINISVREVELFLAVAEAGSILSAAQKMYISQPALSTTIRNMENKLGYALFHRTNHGVSLTDEGIELYSHFHRIYHSFRVELKKTLAERYENSSRTIRIGCLGMNEAISTMQSACEAYARTPNALETSVEFYHFFELYAKLICGDLDIIFTLSFDLENESDFSWHRLLPVEFRFIFPSQWGISCLDEKACDFLTGKPMFLELHNGEEVMKNYCSANGFSPGKMIRVPSFLILLNKISHGEGFTLWGSSLPDLFTARGDISTVSAKKPLSDGDIYIDIMWRLDTTDPVILDFIDIAKHLDEYRPFRSKSKSLNDPSW